MTKHRGSRLAYRGAIACNFADIGPGYWGCLRDLDRLGSRGGLGSGCLLLRPRKGDGWAEGEKSNFDWTCGEFQTLPPATMEGHSVRHPLGVLIVCLDT